MSENILGYGICVFLIIGRVDKATKYKICTMWWKIEASQTRKWLTLSTTLSSLHDDEYVPFLYNP